MSSDSDRAFRFLERLRMAGQSGSVTFGSITAGRVSHRVRDATPARVVADFSKGGLP